MKTLVELLKAFDLFTTVLSILATAASGVLLWAFKTYRKTKSIYKMLVPNGGSSIVDKLNLIIERQAISEIRQQLIWANLEVGYYETDGKGGCTFANDKLCKFFNLPESEMKGSGWLKALRDEDRRRVWENWQVALTEKIPYSDTYSIKDPRTGELRHFKASATAYYNDKGDPIIFFGIVVRIKKTEGDK